MYLSMLMSDCLCSANSTTALRFHSFAGGLGGLTDPATNLKCSVSHRENEEHTLKRATMSAHAPGSILGFLFSRLLLLLLQGGHDKGGGQIWEDWEVSLMGALCEIPK